MSLAIRYRVIRPPEDPLEILERAFRAEDPAERARLLDAAAEADRQHREANPRDDGRER